jgi:hypothetical protein
MDVYNNIPRSEIEIVIARYQEDITLFIPFNNNSVIYNKGNIDKINAFINRDNIINCPNTGREGGTYLKYIIDNYYNLPNYILFTQGNPVDHIHNNNALLAFEKIHEVFKEEKNYKFKYLSTHMIEVKENELYDFTSGIPSLRIELGNPIEVKFLINQIECWLNNNYVDCDNAIKDLLEKLNIYQINNKLIYYYNFTDLYSTISWFMKTTEGKNFRKDISSVFNFNKILPIIKNGYTFGYGAIFIVNKSQIRKYPKDFWENIYISFLEEKPSAGWGLEKLWRFLLE